jgi:hypothetical protein
MIEYPCDDCFESKGPTGQAGKIPFLMKECCDRCLQFSNSLDNDTYPEFASIMPFVYCEECHNTAQQGDFKEEDPNKYYKVSKQYASEAMGEYIDEFIMPSCVDSQVQVKQCKSSSMTPSPAPQITQFIDLEFLDWLSYDYLWLVVLALFGMLLGWCLCACAYCCFLTCPRVFVSVRVRWGKQKQQAQPPAKSPDPQEAQQIMPAESPERQEAQQGTSSTTKSMGCNIQ